jgi:trimethylamine:corrinoid methyltransferase-like protein
MPCRLLLKGAFKIIGHHQISDCRDYENWLDDGGVWAYRRAQKHHKTVLNEYIAPPMDSGHHD